MIKIKQLIWDKRNVKHIAKHNASVNEIEAVCQSAIKTLKTHKGRLIVLGKTKKNRLLTVVLTPEAKGKYYPVTARDMSKKERRILK